MIKFICQWRRKMQFIAVAIREGNGLGMQKQATQSELTRCCIHLCITVAIVADQRMPTVQRMHANLMGPAA